MLFDFLKDNKPKDKTEFTFIWFTKMNNNNVVDYGKPYKTKVYASSIEEARVKIEAFARKKIEIEIHEQGTIDSSKLNKIQVMFEDMSKTMDGFFKEMDRVFKSL